MQEQRQAMHGPIGDPIGEMSAAGRAEAFSFTPGAPGARVLLLCDHASNAMPPEYDNLGLPEGELARHIAHDIGAAGVARHLAALLRAPLLQATFSRLLVDPNRGPDDPTLVMRIADGAIIPGNARIDDSERQRRIQRFWQPYDDAISTAIDHLQRQAGQPPVLVSIHTFTPVWRGMPRRWHAGILHDPACPSISPRLIEVLRRRNPGLVIGANEPYSGGLPGDTLDRHGVRKGLAHTLVEIRQDLVADEAGQRQWAERIAAALGEALPEALPDALPGALRNPPEDVLDATATTDAHLPPERRAGDS